MNPPLTRQQRLLSLIDSQALGLEIGPGFNPLLPKAEGYRVETLDHASQEDLRRKYSGAPGVELEKIEAVDYVSTGASVLKAIGKPGRYRYIVASHVIEHTPDLLGFVRDCEALLEPEGVLALAVPDKRFAFDVLRPLSSTGDVLQAHADGRTRHSAGRLFDEVAYNVLRGGALAWGADNGDAIAFFRPLSDAKAMFDEALHSDTYHDIHAWQFTPSSFRLLLNDLHEIGATGLREAQFFDGLGAEFMISLSRQGAGPSLSRMELATRVFDELREIRTAPCPKPAQRTSPLQRVARLWRTVTARLRR
jgi:hypothetical protein